MRRGTGSPGSASDRDESVQVGSVDVDPSGGGAQPTGTSLTEAGPMFLTGSVKSICGKALTETPRAPSRGTVRAAMTPGRPGTLSVAPPGSRSTWTTVSPVTVVS